MLLGSTVFTDKSGQKVKAKYLSLLLDHDRTGCYAWGVGVLANLYRQLGMASRAEAQGLAGASLLLRVIYMFFSFNITIFDINSNEYKMFCTDVDLVIFPRIPRPCVT